MRDFSKFRPSSWSDEEFVSLASSDHKLCDIYQRTNRHMNSAGVAFLPPEYGAADLQWPLDQYLRVMADLETAGRVKVDTITKEVMIVAWFLDNPPMNELHYRGTVKQAAKIQSPHLREAVLAALDAAWAACAAANMAKRPSSYSLVDRFKVAK